jgi:hypothetical protein
MSRPDTKQQNIPVGLDYSVLKSSVFSALKQTQELINLTETVYAKPPFENLSAIGKHVRHIVDHYWAFHRGLVGGRINYNLRHREIELERKPLLASEALNELLLWFAEESIQNKLIVVESEIAIEASLNAELESTVYRELGFLIGHTYHHLAYASLIAKTLGIEMPAHIGLAPATASFLRAEPVSSDSSTL